MVRRQLSQLVDSRGHRPCSNNDALRLYSFCSNLPIYRKKYDWKVPVWTTIDLRELHAIVGSILIEYISVEVEGLECKLTFLEKQRIVTLLKSVSVKCLYRVFLRLDISSIVAKLTLVVRGGDFGAIVARLAEDEYHIYDIFNIGDVTPGLERKVFKKGVELGCFWASVADEVNKGKRGASSFKLATDCCIKFINSTHDGRLLKDVNEREESRILEFIEGLRRSQQDILDSSRVIDYVERIGVSPFQYLRVALKTRTENRWTKDEDLRLSDAVSLQLMDPASVSMNRTIFWQKVARSVMGRTNEQCRLRWREIDKIKIYEKEFGKRELMRLQLLRTAFGSNWKKIASLMPGRSASQCRWILLKNKRYTEQDYLRIYENIKACLSKLLNSNPGKTPIKDIGIWKRVDWLGAKLLKIAKSTGDVNIINILRTFYESGEIRRRISALFGKCDFVKLNSIGGGIHIYVLSEYMSKLHPQFCSMVNEIVTRLLKKTGSFTNDEFRQLCDYHPSDAKLRESLLALLNAAWP